MPTPDKALALSAVETEQLRDMRNRLGRRAVSLAAQATLDAAFFTLCERVGVQAEGAETLDPATIRREAATADLAALGRLVGALKARKQTAPQDWPAIVAAGAPQAILSRRLALAGREPALDPETL